MEPLPIGLNNFRTIITENLTFVDKSLLIKELLDDRGIQATLITRPRRFGKTLNLSMLHHFFAEQIDGLPTKGLFNGLQISQAGETYMKHQGQYPVVFLSFKDAGFTDFSSTYNEITRLLSRTYKEHIHILDSPKLTNEQKSTFEAILNNTANEAQIHSSLLDLTDCLYHFYGKQAILLIDEYDTPIQTGYLHGHYNETMMFMRHLFSKALKDNRYLFRAILTGILRVSKESLFSGLNNLKIYSVLNRQYSDYFGFTEDEVKTLLTKAELINQLKEIKDWYNGYQIGNTVIYNPWSIVNCIYDKGLLQPYWINTSDNQLIKELLKKAPVCFKTDFETLLAGGSVEKLISEHVVFADICTDTLSVWSLLLMSGYLKPVAIAPTAEGSYCALAVPNNEVKGLYLQIIKQWLSDGYGQEWYNKVINSLLTGEMLTFEKGLQTILLQVASYHDLAREPEAFYHGMLLGFIASLYGSYEIISNREAGLGRLDMALIPKDTAKLPVILEFKIKGNEELDAVAQQALQQIDTKRYPALLSQKTFTQVIKAGIAFDGKEKTCKLVYEIVKSII